MSTCILIPTVNRADLLAEAMAQYERVFPETPVLIWDNGKQGLPEYRNTETFVSDRNLGVAASWNALIKRASDRGFDTYLILNDDVILQCGEETLDRVLANGGDDIFHRCRPFYNWSSFILRKHIYMKVGPFDEEFKGCFFEDNDYEYRMRLSGIHIRYEDELNPGVYRNSQTIEKDPKLGNYIDNRELFIRKWGGMPGSETYLTPYGI
jgi:GT2 family glycosyltransferase